MWAKVKNISVAIFCIKNLCKCICIYKYGFSIHKWVNELTACVYSCYGKENGVCEQKFQCDLLWLGFTCDLHINAFKYFIEMR